MIHLKIKELLLSLGYQRPTKWLMTNCGFSKTKASKLVNQRQRGLSLEDIAILCEKINCLLNELFYWKASLTNPPRLLNPGATSSLLSSTLAPDGDHLLIQNLSNTAVTIDVWVIEA